MLVLADPSFQFCTFAHTQWCPHVQRSSQPGFTRSVAVVVAYLIRFGTVSHSFSSWMGFWSYLMLSQGQLRFTFRLPDLFINLSHFHYLSTNPCIHISLMYTVVIFFSFLSVYLSEWVCRHCPMESCVTRAARLVKHLDLPPVCPTWMALCNAVAMYRYIYLSIYLFDLVCLSILLFAYPSFCLFISLSL